MGKKVLYATVVRSNITQCIIHRYVCNADAEAVLLANKSQCNDSVALLFDNKIYGASMPKPLNNEFSSERYEVEIEHYFDTLFKENGYDIHDFDEVYTICDVTNDIGIYLSIKNVKYYFMECGNFQLTNSRYKVYDWLIAHENPHGDSEYMKCSKKHRSYCGSSPLVIRKICFYDSISKKDDYSNADFFDFTKKLSCISDALKLKILRAFDKFDMEKDYSGRNNTAIIFVQRQWKTSVTVEETGILYQYLSDYFLSEFLQLIIKPHPSDTYNHLDFFPNASVMSKDFPGELLQLIPGLEITEGITISSTSLEKLKTCCNECRFLGDIYYRYWRSINKFYTALSIVKSFGDGYSLFRNGISGGDEFISLFKKYGNIDLATTWKGLKQLAGNQIVLVDQVIFNGGQNLDLMSYNLMLKTHVDNSLIIFLDTDNSYSFFDGVDISLIDNLLPVRISKTPIGEKVYADISDEFIYAYSTDKKVLKQISEMSITKQLKNTKISVTAEALSGIELELSRMKIAQSSLQQQINNLKENKE